MRQCLATSFHYLAMCLVALALPLFLLALLTRCQEWTHRALGVPYGQTRLWHAIGAGDDRLIERALAEGASVNRINDAGNTPLVVAAFCESPRVVVELIACGSDPQQPNAYHVTPLLSAIFANRIDTVKILLEAGARADAAAGDRSPLIAAVRTGNSELLELIIAAGADVNAADASGQTPLRVAVESDQPHLAEILRRHGAGSRSHSPQRSDS